MNAHARVACAVALAVCATSCARTKSSSGPHFRFEEPVARVAQGSGAIYVRIVNEGGDDRLVGVDSPAVADAQLHEFVAEGNLTEMREARGGFAVPGGATLTLAHGGKHVMLFGVKAQEAAVGAVPTIPVVFHFERAGGIKVDVPVRSAINEAAR